VITKEERAKLAERINAEIRRWGDHAAQYDEEPTEPQAPLTCGEASRLLSALDEMERERDGLSDELAGPVRELAETREERDSLRRGYDVASRRAFDYETRAEKAEAACAAMRGCLDQAHSVVREFAPGMTCLDEMCAAALATDAGEQLLARHAEEVAALEMSLRKADAFLERGPRRRGEERRGVVMRFICSKHGSVDGMLCLACATEMAACRECPSCGLDGHWASGGNARCFAAIRADERRKVEAEIVAWLRREAGQESYGLEQAVAIERGEYREPRQ